MTNELLEVLDGSSLAQSTAEDQQRPVRKPHRPWRSERWLLRKFLAAIGDPPVTFVLPGGDEVSSLASARHTRVFIRSRTAVWKMLLDPLLNFPEAYATGQIEVEDLEFLLAEVLQRFDQRRDRRAYWDRYFQYIHLPRGNSLRQSRENIYRHYDIDNDFYRLWLDRSMLYTCAYFSEPSLSLEQAQIAKMDHVCRKLRLRSGMQVIEAGCGWGALALHMAQHYACRVRAYNISRSQIRYAREQASWQGLSGQVEFIEDDWRNIRGVCDAFVSVGMLEHVGRRNYRRLGKVIESCLKPDGIGLIHSIGQNDSRPLNPWIEHRIFPGAYPPTLREMMEIFEPYRFSLLDIENLRLHYAETLRHWLDRFERNAEKVREKFDEKFVRSWRFYLTGSKVAFLCGSLQLFQLVFARGTNNSYPRSRKFMYVDS